MKKSVLIIFVLLIFLVSGCHKEINIETSKENFDVYYNAISDIVSNYGYEIICKDGNSGKEEYNKTIKVVLSETSYIEIYLENFAEFDKKEGTEHFSATYYIDSSNDNDNFNIELFTDIANSVSGKPLSVEFCSRFLAAPEQDYAATKNGFEKLNGEIISKYHNFDFFEDWNIWYNKYADREELTFHGYTKS